MLMDDKLFRVENLSRLLGGSRSEEPLRRLIEQSGSAPVCTADKEDGVDEEFVEFKEPGVGLYFEGDILTSIFLHSAGGGSSYAGYAHPLPIGIRFEHSRAELLGLLGPPDAAGGGRDEFFGAVPSWVKYKTPGYVVHVEFALDSKSVRMVTMTLRFE